MLTIFIAVAEEDFSVDLAKGVLKLDENGNPVKVDEKNLRNRKKLQLLLMLKNLLMIY